MQGTATREKTTGQGMYASLTLIQQARSYFYETFKSRDGPWTMTFAALASGFVLRKQIIVILEGKRQVTETVARDVLALFPAEVIHTEHLGPGSPLTGPSIHHASIPAPIPRLARARVGGKRSTINEPPNASYHTDESRVESR
jgi:hypothetical protein